MDTIFNFLANNYPWLLVTLLSCGIVAWVTRHIVKRLNDIKTVKSDLESLKSDANCKVHKSAIGTTQEDIKSMKDDIKLMLHGISSIKNAIVSIKPSTASLFANANSPLQLNEKGRELIHKLLTQ